MNMLRNLKTKFQTYFFLRSDKMLPFPSWVIKASRISSGLVLYRSPTGGQAHETHSLCTLFTGKTIT